MKKEAPEYVDWCLTCQRFKVVQRHLARLLQPTLVLEWKWETITMDFISGLPKTIKQHDSIMVVVDKLRKYAHFIPVKSNY